MSTWFPWAVVVLGLLIIAGLCLIAWWLTQTYDRLGQLVQQIDNAAAGAVHDALHPAFSLRQLRCARERFMETHKNRLRSEAELYRSAEWLSRRKGSPHPHVALGLRERAKEVFQALVESESAWKEYLFMIEGNVSVASRGESRPRVLEAFAQLLQETRGTAVEPALNSNPFKVERVKALLENWVARISGAEVGSAIPDIPDIGEQMFGDVFDAQQDRNRALEESIGVHGDTAV